jgi:hypothetical protein
MASRPFLTVLLVVFSMISARAEGKELTFVFPQEKNAFHDDDAEIIRQAYAALDITVVY